MKRIFSILLIFTCIFVLISCDKEATTTHINTTQSQTTIEQTTIEPTTMGPTTAEITTRDFSNVDFYVIFESNGGNDLADLHVTEDFLLSQITEPTRNGYLFAGWFTDSNLTYEVSSNDITGNDITLYAAWDIQRYTVHYHYLDSIVDREYEFGETLVFPNITVEEYSIEGYYLDQNFSEPYVQMVMPSEDINIYVNLEINIYNLSFLDMNNNVIYEDDFSYGWDFSEFTLPTAPHEEGYNFVDYYPWLPETMPNQDLILHANYELVEYTVNFYLDNILNDTAIYHLGDTIVLPTLTLDEYSIFDGWYLDDQRDVEYENSMTISTDINLYAFDLLDYAPEDYTDINALIQETNSGEYVIYQGYVSDVFGSGYILTDGSDVIPVYTGAHSINLGDEVEVCGLYSLVNSNSTLSELLDEKVVSTDNSVLPPILEYTVENIENIENLNTLTTPVGTRISVTGYISKIENDFFLTFESNEVLISDDLVSGVAELLETQISNKITITVFFLLNDDTLGVVLGFDGTSGDDITIVQFAPDYLSIQNDSSDFEATIPEYLWGDLVLPEFGASGSVFSNFESSKPSVLMNNGSFLGIPSESQYIEFSYTITKGTKVFDKSINIFVPGIYEVCEKDAASQYPMAAFEAVVYAIADNGFYIHESGSYLYVESENYIGDLEIGDEIQVLVEMDFVTYTLRSYEDISSNIALPTFSVATIAEINFTDLHSQGEVVLVKGNVSVGQDIYGNVEVILEGICCGSLYVHMDSHDYQLIPFDDQYVELEIILHEDGEAFFVGLSEDVTVIETIPTNQEYAEDMIVFLEDYIDCTNLEDNLYLPQSITSRVAQTVTWDSSNQDVISDSGVVTLVYGTVRYADLTVTITVGDYTTSKVFKASVIDKWDASPLTVEQARTYSDGALVKVTGVITGIYEGKAYISTGPYSVNNIYINYPMDSQYSVGQTIIVYGTMNTYSLYGNDKREITGVTKYELSDNGHAIEYDNFSTPEEIANLDTIGDYINKFYSTELTVSNISRSDGYVEFSGNGDTKIIFNPDDYINYFYSMYVEGDSIDLKFIAHEIVNGDLLVVCVEFPEPIDWWKAHIVQGQLSIPGTTTENLVLPTEFPEYWDVNLVWSSYNLDVISNSGVISRPANGEGDISVRIGVAIMVSETFSNYVIFDIVIPELP
jgi:uncharacterized repeat protein (TIGR02543 family)